MAAPIRIGQLRYPLIISQRVENPDPNGAGMIETLLNPIMTVGDVIPTGPMMFYGVIQGDLDRPVTHKIYTRWMPLIDSTFVIQRTMNTPDSRIRMEYFRIWRIQELEGRQRFLQFDAQLERFTYLVDAAVSETGNAMDSSDATITT